MSRPAFDGDYPDPFEPGELGRDARLAVLGCGGLLVALVIAGGALWHFFGHYEP